MPRNTKPKQHKRGQGEGSIYKTRDGQWRAAVSIGWKRNEAGEPVWRRKFITAKTRHAVQERLKKELRDQQRGINIDSSTQSTGEYLRSWLEYTAKPSVRPKTYTSYEQMLRNHLVKDIPETEWKDKKLDSVPGLGRVPLDKLTMQAVQRFLSQKVEAGNSPALVSYLRIVLRAALAPAVRDDQLRHNPAALARPPKVEKHEIVPLTPEEAGRLLNAAMGHRLEALFTVGLAIGLRSGECSALRWADDVDLENGTLTVHHTLQRKKGEGLILLPPKSKKSRRTLELPAVCVAALNAHRERQESERRLAGSAWHDTGHVFTTSIGTPLDDHRVLTEFTELLEVAKIRHQRFHDLRHACVSLLGAQGVPLKVISEIVGHSDIRLTQNLYEHVYKPAKRAAADVMDAIFARATAGAATPVAAPVAARTQSGKVN
jgi:integrase